MLHMLRPTSSSIKRLCYQLRSSSSLPSSLGIGSYGFLRINQEFGAPPVKIEITTGWEDETSINYQSINQQNNGINLNVNKEEQTIELTLKSTGSIIKDIPNIIKFNTPENFGIDISLINGDIEIIGKLHCDIEKCNIKTSNGSIKVNKIRSNEIILEALKGFINVSSVIEANKMNLKGKYINIQRIGSSEQVEVETDCSEEFYFNEMSIMTKELYQSLSSIIVINSLYSPLSIIKCMGNHHTNSDEIFETSTTDISTIPSSKVKNNNILPPMVLIDSMHGFIDIHIDDGYPSQPSSSSSSLSKKYRCVLSLERISGSVNALINYGNIEAHFDIVEEDSYLKTNNGNILLMVNQEAMARINMKVDKQIGHVDDKKEENSKSLIEIVEKDSRFVKVQDSSSISDSSSSSSSSDSDEYGQLVKYESLNGFIRPFGKREDLIGPPGGTYNVGKGKIDLEAAKRFNTSTSFFGKSKSSYDDEKEDDKFDYDETILPPLPTISLHASGGNVKFESLSWKDSIKRKFGL